MKRYVVSFEIVLCEDDRGIKLWYAGQNTPWIAPIVSPVEDCAHVFWSKREAEQVMRAVLVQLPYSNGWHGAVEVAFSNSQNV